MFRPMCLVLLACTFGLAAHAEEGGQLTLEIDGQSYAYTLWPSQSDWSGSDTFGSVSIYARPADDTSQFKDFMLGFSLSAGAAQEGEINLRTVENGKTLRYYAGADEDEGALAVTLDSVSASGEELSISGTFQTRLGTSENYGRDIDLSGGPTLAGTFDVTLGPVE